MKKKLITVIVIAVILILGFFVLNNYIYNEKQGDSISQEYVDLFRTELTSQGVERVGQPIEGFDAYSLLQAFPGLEESDFDLVDSFEGVYEYVDGELEYKRLEGQPVTSAEQTVSEDGYRRLLDNVTYRLDIDIDSEGSVMDLIDSLKFSLDETFTSEDNSISFNYPSDLETNYINTVDWPPQVQILDEEFSCLEAGSEIDRAGRTEQVEINDRDYCVTTVAEGAAGSTYRQYAYASPFGEDTLILTFSLRFPQCGNFPEAERTLCEREYDSFDLNLLMDSINQSIESI